MAAFDEGIEAWCDGKDSEDNPYIENSKKYLKWEDGYYSIATMHEDDLYERNREVSREMAMDACDMSLDGREV